MSNQVSASDIKLALIDRYPAPQFALLWEVGNGTGSNLRRWADAVSMCLYPSRGLEIEGIEIKVSRSDWLRELKNVAKSAPVQKHCDRWWIAAPKKLIHADELPATWGLMELLSNGRLRAVKPAPKLEAEPVTKSFMAGMLRRASDADAGIVNKMVRKEVDRDRERMRKEYDLQFSRRQKRIEESAEKIRQIKEATGVDLNGWTPSEQIIAAIQFGLKFADGKFGALDQVANQCERLSANIRKLTNPDAEVKDG